MEARMKRGTAKCLVWWIHKGIFWIPGCPGFMMAVVRLCSLQLKSDGESNLSCSRAASNSRALIRRPPGLPASVWSSGLSYSNPPWWRINCFDYFLNKPGEDVSFAGCKEGWSCDCHIYWMAFITFCDLSVLYRIVERFLLFVRLVYLHFLFYRRKNNYFGVQRASERG